MCYTCGPAGKQAGRQAGRQPGSQAVPTIQPNAAIQPAADHPSIESIHPFCDVMSGSHSDSDLPNQDRDCYLCRRRSGGAECRSITRRRTGAERQSISTRRRTALSARMQPKGSMQRPENWHLQRISGI